MIIPVLKRIFWMIYYVFQLILHIIQWTFWSILMVAKLILIGAICWFAFDLRMYAIRTFGRVIHEFDPWFNFRATQYLADHGMEKFFKWYDYRSWYPLGRPVGTTIYPGMQVLSVSVWKILNMISIPVSLNDVCCFVPCWGGVTASLLVGLLTRECTDSTNSGIVAAGVMSIIPAHLMRSVGGGYDNESVAVSALCLTFFLWCRSLRTPKSWPFGILTGLAYFFMVAAWGGYIFVINMIGVHAAVLIGLGHYSTSLYRAYTLFFVIGTAGAIQVPVVGWTPLRSLEQICPLILFFGFQLLEFCAIIRRKKKLGFFKFNLLRLFVFGIAGVFLAVITSILLPMGYFGPLSARIRGLFVKHTRTGNPLVDSVAEHQPANANAYNHYLQDTYKIAPLGFCILLIPHILHPIYSAISCLCKKNRTEEVRTGRVLSSYFLLLYAVISYYFSNKMARLIILLGPITSALTGVVFGILLDWSEAQFFDISKKELYKENKHVENIEKEETKEDTGDKTTGSHNKQNESNSSKKNDKNKKGKENKKSQPPQKTEEKNQWRTPAKLVIYLYKVCLMVWNNFLIRLVRKLVTIAFLYGTFMFARDFNSYCQTKRESMSQPSIMFKGKLHSGEEIIVDDYRAAYWWLRDNTPEDSRVMAWWDYGYQIAGIGNRTTIADGNTWNHEHIALLGRCLTSPEKRAHRIIRHLADYVLVWTGGGGDDLAKSPHMARIGNSVFDDICPNDPTCRRFGFDRQRNPTPMMAASLLYRLHSSQIRPGVTVDPNRFREVYQSKYGKVRIYKVLKVSKKSKNWIADPKNRVCDAPGSWYCGGQYPPALDKVLAKRRSFSQLEDFNKKRDAKAEAYNKLYHEHMGGG